MVSSSSIIKIAIWSENDFILNFKLGDSLNWLLNDIGVSSSILISFSEIMPGWLF
jgi:hypothetical protein